MRDVYFLRNTLFLNDQHKISFVRGLVSTQHNNYVSKHHYNNDDASYYT